MEQWLLLEKHFLKTIFKSRVVRQKKRIRITHDQEFDEIEGRIQKEEEKIERYAKDRINLDKRPK